MESHDAKDVEACDRQGSAVSVCCLCVCWMVLLDGREAAKCTEVQGREEKEKHDFILKKKNQNWKKVSLIRYLTFLLFT